MNSCPSCYSKFRISTEVHSVDPKMDMLRQAFIGFLLWKHQGEPKYRQQYYYDNYHSHIAHVEGDVFKFRIQVYDSPKGDTWWSGQFRARSPFALDLLDGKEQHV